MMPPDREEAAKLRGEEASSLDASVDADEPTSEELVDMLRQALHEAETGQTRPSREIMRELREMLAADGDAS